MIKRVQTQEEHMEEIRAGMKGREHEHDGADVPERMGLKLQGSAVLPGETIPNSIGTT